MVHATITKQYSSLRDIAAHNRFTSLEWDGDSVLIDEFGSLPPDEQLQVYEDWFGALGFPSTPVQLDGSKHDGYMLFMPRVGKAHPSNYRVVCDIRKLTIMAHVSMRRISTVGTLEVGAPVYPRPPDGETDGLRFSGSSRSWVRDTDENGQRTIDDPDELAKLYPDPCCNPAFLWG